MSVNSTTNCIETNKLSKKYADFQLKDISFNLPSGSIMGFIGENGAGKTTAIKLLLGLISGGGDVKIFGKDIKKNASEIKEQIGIVLDNSFFSDYMDTNQVNMVLKNIYKSWDEKRYFELIDRLGVPRKKLIKELSKGTKTKLQIITAMAHNPRLLILDEPTSGLDPIVRSEILDLFLDFIQDERNSIFLSSHITSDLEKIADYITFIHKGELVFSESRDEVLENYGVLKCSDSEIGQIESGFIIAKESNKFGCEALIKNRADFVRKYPTLLTEKPTLDEIMRFFVKGDLK